MMRMLSRPKNRRRTSQKRWRLPRININWRALGMTLGTLAAIAGLGLGAVWAFDQPIETVAVEGRFQRVAPGDVERAVKARLHGAGLLSVDLSAVSRALHAHCIHPRERVDCAAYRRQVDRQESGPMQARFDRPLDVPWRDALEASFDGDRLDGLIERPDRAEPEACDGGERSQRHAQRAPVDVDARQSPALLRSPAAVLRAREHAHHGCAPSARCAPCVIAPVIASALAPNVAPVAAPAASARRAKLVSSTRQTRVSKSTPTARAAIGTRLWLVIPGMVLISRSSGRPVASITKSARPHPEAPTDSNAATPRFLRCASADALRPEGQK